MKAQRRQSGIMCFLKELNIKKTLNFMDYFVRLFKYF